MRANAHAPTPPDPPQSLLRFHLLERPPPPPHALPSPRPPISTGVVTSQHTPPRARRHPLQNQQDKRRCSTHHPTRTSRLALSTASPCASSNGSTAPFSFNSAAPPGGRPPRQQRGLQPLLLGALRRFFMAVRGTPEIPGPSGDLLQRRTDSAEINSKWYGIPECLDRTPLRASDSHRARIPTRSSISAHNPQEIPVYAILQYGARIAINE